MSSCRASAVIRVAVLVILSGCRTAFQPAKFTDNEALFAASVQELNQGHWDNATAGFERLTVQLPARHPLMPRSHFYLGKTRERKREYLLAAQSYTRIVESFPDDTLADDGLLQAGRAYSRLWRKPYLDSEYGETAISTFQTLVALFPNSPLAAEAQKEIARLNEWFATKVYLNGMHYFRRKAMDSAIIYFDDIVRLYPSTSTARDALLRLAEAYKHIKYRDDAKETCSKLRQSYPGDRDVDKVCGDAPRAAVSPLP